MWCRLWATDREQGTMTRRTRRIATLATTGAATTALALAPGAQAGPAQTADVDASSGPTHMTWTGHRAADAPANTASGFFQADLKVNGLGLMHLEGPVTCMTVKGNHVGMFYPVTKASPSLLASGTGVYINLTNDGNGHAKSFSFSLVPRTKVPICDPAPTFMPLSGKAVLTS